MAINDRQQWGEYAYGDDFRTYERFGYPYGPYEGFGYEGYGYEPRRKMGPGDRRPDERSLDDVWRRMWVTAVDPQDVEIEVNGAVVTLWGRVSTRVEKRVIEDIADSVFGVREVHNHLRLARIGSESRGAETGPLATNAGSPATQRSFDTTVGETERH